MTDKYFKSKTAMATAASVTRNTLNRWMLKSDFPKQTTNGWERVKVLEFAKVALAKAATCQTGSDQDLKRKKLHLQCEILETQLQRQRGELATETEGTIPRPVAIEQLAMVCFAVWSSMNAKITTLGNTTLAGNCAAYTCLCNSGTEFLQGAKREVARRLKESPLKLTTEEIEDCTRYQGGNRW